MRGSAEGQDCGDRIGVRREKGETPGVELQGSAAGGEIAGTQTSAIMAAMSAARSGNAPSAIG